MKNLVISFCLGFLLALGVGFADAGQNHKTLIDSLDKADLKGIISMMMKRNDKLLQRCLKYNYNIEKFDTKTCEPALKEFRSAMNMLYEDLYFPQ